jgi:hypothetical protein
MRYRLSGAAIGVVCMACFAGQNFHMDTVATLPDKVSSFGIEGGNISYTHQDKITNATIANKKVRSSSDLNSMAEEKSLKSIQSNAMAVKKFNKKNYLMDLAQNAVFECNDDFSDKRLVCSLNAILTESDKKANEKIDPNFSFDGTSFYFIIRAGWSSRIVKVNPAKNTVQKVSWAIGVPAGIDNDNGKLWYMCRKSDAKNTMMLKEIIAGKDNSPAFDIPCSSCVGLQVKGNELWTARDNQILHLQW